MLYRLMMPLIMVCAAAVALALANGRRLDQSIIAFHSNLDGDNDIYLLDARVRTLFNLTRDHEGYDADPAWSPDGQYIAFTSLRPDNGVPRPVSVHIMRYDGHGVRRLTSLPGGEPAWSPDGEQIAFATVADYIVTVPAAGGDERGVTAGESPVWSPDGRWLLSRLPFDRGILRAASLDGEPWRDLLTGPFLDPAWSPDGQTILVSVPEGGSFDLFGLDSTCRANCGSQLIRLNDWPSEDLSAAWSPDGERIVYVCNTRGHSELCLMNADGSGRVVLTNLPRQALAGAPAWRP